MPLNREHALDILGLPTFASEDDVILRYKVLSLMWFPENHVNSNFALQEFRNVTEATLSIIFPRQVIPRQLNLPAMYSFFQYVFFGSKETEAECCCDTDDNYDSEDNSVFSNVMTEELANENAFELLEEEEREKNKADKKKAKKKRRKARKKLEKLEQKNVTEQEKSNSFSQTKAQDSKSSESEEDIDPHSAFVSVIAKKHKMPQAVVEVKEVPQQRFTKPKEDPICKAVRSQEIALEGNVLAKAGQYAEAAELFSEAIKIYPSDYRFYGNRSFCYERLNLYERALQDADKSLVMCPEWSKGHFRRGQALLGLKKYALAEKSFDEVLKYDPECTDVIPEIYKSKVLQLMAKGYSKEHSEIAITNYDTVTEALRQLVIHDITRVHIPEDIFISDDEETVIGNSLKKTQQVASYEYDIKRDPRNPEGHTSLWVGNVQADVSEKKLHSMFAKYGDIISVKVMPEKFCAFINYKNKASPGKAMQAYQGMELSGTKICIRFPNLPGETTVPKKKTANGESNAQTKGPVNGNECYYWRTTGCTYAEQCRYKHIKSNKGIDKKKWMA